MVFAATPDPRAGGPPAQPQQAARDTFGLGHRGARALCCPPVRDRLYENVPFRLPEIEHRYGPNVHMLANPFLLGQLAKLCAKETVQPEVNRLVGSLYRT